ncbi:hypothetical protein SAMN04488112_11713 [Melghirimyces thermohalophilus]|uniref:HTH marR-type domain-containing protein n=2 Tax=Melghirimyces thermohalophilus TaxID=1236220 RepID=A0A1G6PKD8_9BACL|nr:hypothetical protein [Melghirimyces thermohalophilus]SDC80529.1 hypothetical protein SAMN04488112_11713 [Melghirimyces thermohalophilus]
MTHIANRLIKDGYAERKADEKDRRVIYLQMTETGEQVLAEAREKGEQLRLDLFQALDETEIRKFLSIYKKLLEQSESL